MCASRRNAVLGFAGACAGLLLPFKATAAQTTLKVDFPVARADQAGSKAYAPSGMYQKADKASAGGLTYVGRGGKGGTGG